MEAARDEPARRLRLRRADRGEGHESRAVQCVRTVKRHLFDEAAREHGYDVVATGHNLDDEAAVLFGNVLRWQTDYLGRQLPVLPARNGFRAR